MATQKKQTSIVMRLSDPVTATGIFTYFTS